MSDSVFSFRFAAAVGIVIGYFQNIDYSHLVFYSPMIEIVPFKQWLVESSLKLVQVACTGLVAGFFGLLGKKLFEKKGEKLFGRWYGRNKKGGQSSP